MNDIPGIDMIPEPYRRWVLLAIITVPWIGRAIHAVRNEGGLVGVWNAIVFGTNAPKQKDPPQ